jgi:hypothetical protein
MRSAGNCVAVDGNKDRTNFSARCAAVTQRKRTMAQCPACQQQFSCGADQHSDQPCWCSLLPPLANAGPAATACYCPDCLERLLLLQSQQTAGADR